MLRRVLFLLLVSGCSVFQQRDCNSDLFFEAIGDAEGVHIEASIDGRKVIDLEQVDLPWKSETFVMSGGEDLALSTSYFMSTGDMRPKIIMRGRLGTSDNVYNRVVSDREAKVTASIPGDVDKVACW